MKLRTLGCIFLASCGILKAETAFKAYADFDYTSEYNFRGIKKTQNAFDPNVGLDAFIDQLNVGELVVDSFVEAKMTAVEPVTKSFGDEINFYAAYGWNLKHVTADLGATYYWYPQAHSGRGQTEHTLEAGPSLTWTNDILDPSLEFYYDFRLRSETVQLSLTHRFPLSHPRASANGSRNPADEKNGLWLEVSGTLGNVSSRNQTPDLSGSRIVDSYSYVGADFELPYYFDDDFTVYVGADFSGTRNLAGVGGPNAPQTRDNAWFTCGATQRW